MNPPNKLNLLGYRFGNIICIEYVWDAEKDASSWICKCDCGNTKKVTTCSLRAGTTRSCGCLHKKQLSDMMKTHGLSKSKEYKVWCAMIERCTKPTNKSFCNYGGRGIKVSDKWMKFVNFIKDMGMRPTNAHTLERIDNNGDYTAVNCKWATRAEQRRNCRRVNWITINGEKLCLTDWCKKIGISRKTVRQRIAKGLTIEQAITSKKRIAKIKATQ